MAGMPSDFYPAVRSPDPDPEVHEPDVAAALTGLAEALAPLTPSSTSAQQRAALLAAREALNDALGV